MKYHSEFSEQYAHDICNALKEEGIEMKTKFFKKPFEPENIETMTKFLQEYVVYSLDLFTFLDSKGLVNRGRCPYTGQTIDQSFPSWSYMNSRRVYVSHEGMKIMQKEDDEDYEQVMGRPAPPRNQPSQSSGGSGGCYIATVCYGNDECLEVIALKQYRDEVLSKHWFGRTFIKLYYWLSPSVANSMRNKMKFNSFVKKNFLDKIVKRISQ